jgi:hypothetical protein
LDVNAGAQPSDRELDALRQIGDPPVDALVQAHLAAHPGDLKGLLGVCFGTPRLPQEHPLIGAFMKLPEPELSNPEALLIGQEVFELFGPEILLVLGSCALPLAYAAGHGVQVVARARRLKDDPIRRLCDTAQMVINVMQPGQLGPGGLGRYSARKVRFIHALIRRQVQGEQQEPWNPAWGTPINQEDQAGTLLTFSVGVLHGLRRIGVQLSPQQADAYIEAWAEIGRLLGVEEALLPVTEAAARPLAFRIGERQIRRTDEGRMLTVHLLDAVDSLFPVQGYATSLSHFFLEDTAFGQNVAEVLGLPPANWTRLLVGARAAQKRAVLQALDWVPGAKRRRSFVARYLLQRLLQLRRPESNVPFEVPERLKLRWRLGKR